MPPASASGAWCASTTVTSYAELNGKTPLEVANDGISLYVSIGGPNLLTQFATRYC